MIRRIAAVQVISLVTLVGCGSPPVECGGRVSPERLSEEARIILERVRIDSRRYCSGDQVGCAFNVHKRSSGWAVGVVRSRGHEGQMPLQAGSPQGVRPRYRWCGHGRNRWKLVLRSRANPAWVSLEGWSSSDRGRA